MLTSTDLAKYKPVRLPIYAPDHAEHLYGDADIEAILERTPPHILELCDTSKSLAVNNLSAILRSSLRQILMEPVVLTSLLKWHDTDLLRAHSVECTLAPIAATGVQSMASELIKAGFSKVNIDSSYANQAQASARHASPPDMQHAKLAIVGFSGRFPEADNMKEFWELLRQVRDVHREIPADRFDAEAHYDPTGKRKNTSRVKHGCFIREPGLFDEKVSNPKNTTRDPRHRWVLTSCSSSM